ncbi:flagellar assembly factor FliW [Betaproteobacteria bacterium]|nr:flagellar assembly factor FliW [Betaproteobacteria bacterium]GHU40719.1 flagellar assembly factor FliW [Betaproteobacteria bacterium]
MSKVKTFLFGDVEVNPDLVIEFPQGLVNFESNKKFLLIHETDVSAEPVSFTLQSLDDPNVAFQIIEPAALGFTYELGLNDEETTLLKLDKPEDVVVVVVLFKQQEAASGLAANLRAPLILNTKTKRGLQKVLTQLRPNVVLSNLSNPA